FEYQPNYVFTGTIDDIQKIKDEAEIINKFGGKARYLEAKDIEISNLVKVVAAVKLEKQAQFNPYKYANAIVKKCVSPRLNIYENTKVVDVIEEEKDYVVKVQNGKRVKTKYLVLATKYPIVNIPGFYFLKMYQDTSYAVGMKT